MAIDKTIKYSSKYKRKANEKSLFQKRQHADGTIKLEENRNALKQNNTQKNVDHVFKSQNKTNR